MNSKHRKTLEAVSANPINGNIQWWRIEALLLALDVKVVESKGSSVSFVKGEEKLIIHRPHPNREALRYRIKSVREFLKRIEVE